MQPIIFSRLFYLATVIAVGYTGISGSFAQSDENDIEVIQTNAGANGLEMSILVTRGPEHNHPLMALWVEDTTGKYIQTLYVAKSIATSRFNYGDNTQGQWSEGIVRRPAALPYWAHKRGIIASDGLYVPDPEKPVPDAYTGPTPKSDFKLYTQLDDKKNPAAFYVLLEVNQPWDWNEYWTNNKYPGDSEYATSSQPSVVYRARVDTGSEIDEFEMAAVGHGHFSGEDGSLNTDLSTLTTALEIIDRIVVKFD